MVDSFRLEEIETVARSHPSISGISVKKRGDDGFDLQFQMRVQIPCGGSENGVRNYEPVKLIFPPAWPMAAPQIRLRKDFNRDIAHINPSYESDPQYVEPCIADEPLDVFVRAKGLLGLFDQLQEWLDNAAFDMLRKRDGAWEPMRREALRFFVIADESALIQRVGRKEGYKFLDSTLRADATGEVEGCFFTILGESSNSSKSVLNNFDISQKNAFLIWGSDKKTVSEIFPDGRHQLAKLIKAADLYGCGSIFIKTIDSIAQKVDKIRTKFPFLVIFAVRRPARLATIEEGQSSNIELLPYLIFIQPDKLRTGNKKDQLIVAKRDSPTYSIMLRGKVTPKLLQRISGIEYSNNQGISLLGCGSLGSKIAMHLGKSGFGSQHLIDKSVIMPHNLARMGVVTCHRHQPYMCKVNSVVSDLKTLGHAPTNSTDDIVSTAVKKGKLKLPNDTALIIDTTASQNVHDMLCCYPISPSNARIAQASFYASGKIGVLAVESDNHDVDIEHLLSCFWRYWMLHDGWPGGNLSPVDLGGGCSSLTMVMSDMQASLLSAGISNKILNLLSSSVTSEGQLNIGIIDDDDCSVQWHTKDVKSAIPTKTEGRWRVDVLSEVNDEIVSAVERAGENETGGYLLGRINWVLNRITIAAQLPAPPDSKSSKNCFILGTEGAGKNLEKLYLKSQKSFTVCGTWHSHPRGGEESNIDLKTLEQLSRQAIGLPMVSLIWRQEGYLALVQQSFSDGE